MAAAAAVNLATIVQLERGDILTPQPDTLRALAQALGLPMSDLLTITEWLPPGELPTVRPYLRAKYGALPDEAVAEVEALMEQLVRKHGVHGPIADEDEN